MNKKNILISIGVLGIGIILYKLLLGLVLPIALFVSLGYVLKFLLKDSESDSVKEVSQIFTSSDSSSSTDNIVEIKDLVVTKIISNPLIKSFTLPSLIHGVMFTKSLPGNGYGMHVDNPYMPSGRSDLSFTLFLNEPENYEGGSLCIQTINETKEIKLSAGEMIIYPSTKLHSVSQVKKGERFVCVGWIQSYVQNNEDRSFLFGLDAGAKGLLAKHGRSDELDLIFQSYSNLLRRLGD